jgi:arsenate reductase (thioredoxin)
MGIGFTRTAFLISLFCAGCASVWREAPTRVLFVCQHGSVKSAIAREHLRRMAAARGLRVNVTSRGIEPSEDVSPALRAALVRDGINTQRDPLQRLAQADLDDADVVVVFNPLPERLVAHSIRDWSDTPSMNEDYLGARSVLEPRLEALLEEIAVRTQ